MATYTRELMANLGALKTGLTTGSTLYYTVVSTDGSTTYVPRTNTGVAEIGATGVYRVAVANWDESWSGSVRWDVTSGQPLAVSTFDPIIKTGYALTAGEHTLISGTDVPAALTAQGYTMARAPKLDFLDLSISTIAQYIDTEVAAIKAKTDNLPIDPADASDIAASFASITTLLNTLSGYVDTEVAAIKAKTDFLPSAAAGTTSGLPLKSDIPSAGPSAGTIADAVVAKNEIQNMAAAVGSVDGGTRTGVTGQPTITETLVRPDGGIMTRTATDTDLTVAVTP
jgi:hypothetical protein